MTTKQLTAGQAVRITAGTYAGRIGKVSRATDRLVVVCLPPFNRLVYLDGPGHAEAMPGTMDRMGVYHANSQEG